MILNGNSIDTTSNITGISKDRINECLPAHKFKHDKKYNKINTNKSTELPHTTQLVQSDECLTLIKDIHAMLKILVSEKSKSETPPQTVLDMLIESTPKPVIKKKVIIPKLNNCLVQDD
jgi:hypothetical protein